MKLRFPQPSQTQTIHSVAAAATALCLALLPTVGHAEQTGLSAEPAAPNAPALEDAHNAESAPSEDKPRSRSQILAGFCGPFFDSTAGRTLVQLGHLSALLNSDSQAISDWDRGNPRDIDPLELELPAVSLSTSTATLLLRTLRESEGDSERRNKILSVMLLANPANDETRLLTIRALGHELARLRGEPPQPVITVSIASFALNQSDAIARTDPRHRLSLLEALIEIRDFAGVERATRGYDGHSLQPMLEPYRRATEFEERRVEVSDTIAEQLGHANGARLLAGMYQNQDGNLVWIAD